MKESEGLFRKKIPAFVSEEHLWQKQVTFTQQ